MARFFTLLSALCVLTFSFSPSANAASANEASAYVESLGNQTVGIIANTKLAKPQKQARLERVFAENVDIAWVGRFVMGRFWKQATPEQQKRYLGEYQKFVITHYASRFADYSNGKFTITGTKETGDGEYTVSMQMHSGDKGAEPVLVDYRVHGTGGGLKVFDVIVEGVSMITTQRSEFNAVLNNQGIDVLIQKLANKSLSPDAAR